MDPINKIEVDNVVYEIVGKSGPQGEVGPRGPQGFPGEQGPQGEQGPVGDASEKIAEGAYTSIPFTKFSPYKVIVMQGYKENFNKWPDQCSFVLLPDKLQQGGEACYQIQALAGKDGDKWGYLIRVKYDTNGTVYWWTDIDYGGSTQFIVTKIVGIK